MTHHKHAMEQQAALKHPQAAGGQGITITAVRTRNGQSQYVSLFNPFTDHIVLDIDYNLDAAVLGTSGLVLAGIWEILEARTNQVVAYYRFQSDNPLKVPSVLWWLDIGTAQDAGLQWVAGDIFGFRGIVEAYQNAGPQGLQTLRFFDVSDITWFRLMNLATL